MLQIARDAAALGVLVLFGLSFTVWLDVLAQIG